MAAEEAEIIAIRHKLRTELAEWIEARIPDFLIQLGGAEPALPVVEDFRLLICLNDGADALAPDYYPDVSSGSAHHRQLGLVRHDLDYLSEPTDRS